MDNKPKEQNPLRPQIFLGVVGSAFLLAILAVIFVSFRNNTRAREEFLTDSEALATLSNIQRHWLLLHIETRVWLEDPNIGIEQIENQRALLNAQIRVIKPYLSENPSVSRRIANIESNLNEYDRLLTEAQSTDNPQTYKSQLIELLQTVEAEEIKRAYDQIERNFFTTLSQSLSAQQNIQILLVVLAVFFTLFVISAGVWASRTARTNAELQQRQVSTLEANVRTRTQALTNVAEISTTTSSMQNLEKMLETFVYLTQRRFGLYHAHVFLLDEETHILRIMACGWKEGDEHEGTHGTTTIPIDQEQSLVARAARSKKPVIVNDVRSDAGWLPNPLLPDTAAELAVPLLIGDKVIGVLDVQSDQKDIFTDADAEIQLTLSAQAAIAIQNIRQYENSQKVANDLSVVAQVGIATATITDINTLLQEVVDLSKKSFNLYHAHIYMLNEAGDTLQLTAGADEVGRKMAAEGRSISIDSEKSLVARAARSQQGVVVNDVAIDPEFLPNPLLPDTHAEMAVPMIVNNRVIGVLDVQSETVGRFTEVDVNIKTTLASQIAVAVQNIRNFEQSKRQAEREAAVNLIAQRIQNTTSVENALQVAARELGHALGMKPTAVTLEPVAADRKAEI